VIALVERWIPESQKFHLPIDECTITLEDVALQLGLCVDGRPVIGPTYYDWEQIYRYCSPKECINGINT